MRLPEIFSVDPFDLQTAFHFIVDMVTTRIEKVSCL